MALPPLIQALLKPAIYPAGANRVELAETHISWVLLAGDYAYKIKKPVDFGFLDFSTLAKRRHYCEEEIRLNRRLAPDLYLGVLPIAGTADLPVLDGAGSPIEYAVHMRRFAENARYNRLAESGQLAPQHIDTLADLLADFHAQAPRDGKDAPAEFRKAAEENFIPLLARWPEPASMQRRQLERLHRWTSERLDRLQPLLIQRQQQGRARECHGDLHLGNIVWHQGRPLPFDCIEFSAGLRWLDVLSELAFTAMDLEAYGLPHLAWRLLNRYLEHSGDYAGLALWDDYRAYRALVRSKVAALSAGPTLEGESAATCQRYLALAGRIAQGRRAWLAITHGVAGSGKTSLSGTLLETLGAVRLRSDVERKRLHGLAATAASSSAVGDGLYSAAATRRTYRHLLDCAESLLRAAQPAIVDATFLRRADRDAFRRLAEACGVPFLILHANAPADVLRQRVTRRLSASRDASEATLPVLERQLATLQPLDGEELKHALTVDTTADADRAALISAAARRLGTARLPH